MNHVCIVLLSLTVDRWQKSGLVRFGFKVLIFKETTKFKPVNIQELYCLKYNVHIV